MHFCLASFFSILLFSFNNFLTTSIHLSMWLLCCSSVFCEVASWCLSSSFDWKNKKRKWYYKSPKETRHFKFKIDSTQLTLIISLSLFLNSKSEAFSNSLRGRGGPTSVGVRGLAWAGRGGALLEPIGGRGGCINVPSSGGTWFATAVGWGDDGGY